MNNTIKNIFVINFFISIFLLSPLTWAEPNNPINSIEETEDLLIGKTFLDTQVDKMLKKFSKKENPVEMLYDTKKNNKVIETTKPKLEVQASKSPASKKTSSLPNNNKQSVSPKKKITITNTNTNTSNKPNQTVITNKVEQIDKASEEAEQEKPVNIETRPEIKEEVKQEITNTQNEVQVNSNTKSDEKDEEELQSIVKDKKKNKKEIVDTINFIQPSLDMNKEDLAKIDLALSNAEQEQLTILWRATLERNKTIHFIVEKLAPDDQSKKKNQALSQILNTAIFLPFYALQAVAPADTSSLASYLGAGLASDLINGKSKKNSDRIQLSQTEMVIMFMMIDQVAERLRNQFHLYKQEKVDEALAIREMEDAKREALAALEIKSPESQFLSQVRIRQLEREIRRIQLRMRSNRLILIDLCGSEAVAQVDELINREITATIN